MTSRRIGAMGMSAFITLLIGATGCDNNTYVANQPPGGSSNLVVSNSSPPDGDGTLTATANLSVNEGGTGFDEVRLSQTVGGIAHNVYVRWDTTTHVINSAQHVCRNGANSCGSTLCDPSSTLCDLAKLAVDFPGQTVTFTGLVLTDDFGGTTSATLSGTLAW